jgi:predicted ATP-grasp superfamily ATP-dependent carboligase
VLQEHIAGQPGSVLFAADGHRCVVLGVTRQLIGDQRFAAHAYRYCGNVLAPPDDPEWGAHSLVAERGAAIAAALTRAFGLVGVNGVDVIVGRDYVVPIEINPRYTAAMELAERRDGISIFGAHVAGCTGQLGTLALPAPRPVAVGKALVFARRAVIVRTSDDWLSDPDVSDVPASGTAIPSGWPICTIFAAGSTASECHALLVERAARIHAQSERPQALSPL